MPRTRGASGAIASPSLKIQGLGVLMLGADGCPSSTREQIHPFSTLLFYSGPKQGG